MANTSVHGKHIYQGLKEIVPNYFGILSVTLAHLLLTCSFWPNPVPRKGDRHSIESNGLESTLNSSIPKAFKKNQHTWTADKPYSSMHQRKSRRFPFLIKRLNFTKSWMKQQLHLTLDGQWQRTCQSTVRKLHSTREPRARRCSVQLLHTLLMCCEHVDIDTAAVCRSHSVMRARTEKILASSWGSFSSYLDTHQKQPGKRSIGCLIWRMNPLTNASPLPSAELKWMLTLDTDPWESATELRTLYMD